MVEDRPPTSHTLNHGKAKAKKSQLIIRASGGIGRRVGLKIQRLLVVLVQIQCRAPY
jgi:hypothetical protein